MLGYILIVLFFTLVFNLHVELIQLGPGQCSRDCARSKLNDLVQFVSKTCFIESQSNVHLDGTLRVPEKVAFSLSLIVHCLHISVDIIGHLVEGEFPVLLCIVPHVQALVPLTVLNAAIVTDVHIVA